MASILALTIVLSAQQAQAGLISFIGANTWSLGRRLKSIGADYRHPVLTRVFDRGFVIKAYRSKFGFEILSIHGRTVVADGIVYIPARVDDDPDFKEVLDHLGARAVAWSPTDSGKVPLYATKLEGRVQGKPREVVCLFERQGDDLRIRLDGQSTGKYPVQAWTVQAVAAGILNQMTNGMPEASEGSTDSGSQADKGTPQDQSVSPEPDTTSTSSPDDEDTPSDPPASDSPENAN